MHSHKTLSVPLRLAQLTEDEAEPMDTSDVLSNPGSLTLTVLNVTQDTFETFLLFLLRAYTRSQREGSSVSTGEGARLAQVRGLG